MHVNNYLLCYDIANPRRLQRVYRACCRAGTPYQYSVFHLQGSLEMVDELLAKLAALIDPDQDDLRLYRIGGPETIACLGCALTPSDTYFV